MSVSRQVSQHLLYLLTNFYCVSRPLRAASPVHVVHTAYIRARVCVDGRTCGAKVSGGDRPLLSASPSCHVTSCARTSLSWAAAAAPGAANGWQGLDKAVLPPTRTRSTHQLSALRGQAAASQGRPSERAKREPRVLESHLASRALPFAAHAAFNVYRTA